MKTLYSHAHSVLKRAVPTQIIGDKSKKRMIRAFAERSNMVYFGFVSQLSDEHRIVRGLTVSNQHKDDHYCIGTYKNYDVVFVERTDTILTKNTHSWHIMEFDLHSLADLPHLFIGSGQHGLGFHHLLETKYRSVTALNLGLTGQYPSHFTTHFTIYANPSHGLQVETLIDPATADLLGTHFKGLVAEIHSGNLYVYSERPRLSDGLLDTMIANGIWLARKIDEKSQLL